jgi:Tfp pilus assembly protein PilN
MKEINLIPYHIKQTRLKRNNLIKMSVGVTLVAIFLIIGACYPYVKIKKLNNKAIELKAQIEKENISKNENTKLKTEITPLKDYIDKVDSIQKNKIAVYPGLKNIEKYLPTDVIIKSLNYSNGTINISATCKQYHSIDELLANFQESKEYRKSSVSNISSINDANINNQGGYTFTLNIEEVKVANK